MPACDFPFGFPVNALAARILFEVRQIAGDGEEWRLTSGHPLDNDRLLTAIRTAIDDSFEERWQFLVAAEKGKRDA
jgi:hypothetical protein